ICIKFELIYLTGCMDIPPEPAIIQEQNRRGNAQFDPSGVFLNNSGFHIKIGRLALMITLSKRELSILIDKLIHKKLWRSKGRSTFLKQYIGATEELAVLYYTSPISNYTFTMKSEVLEYLFSGTDERMLESKERGAENTLQRQHEWLPKGWVMEVRAGGEKADKMYKFYVHSITGLRLLSKQDVLLYINEAKVSGCDTNEQCDTTSEDNILSKVDFRPSGLPEGWVKELVYRKTKEGLIRRDPYYTDPASSYTFRTLKSALSFLETGKVSERAFIQRTSVHDLYSFEISTDMHESLRNRLGINEKPYQEPTKSSRSRRAPKIDQEQNIDH
ncbi:hypothetical protein ACJX0J_009481, partial [Zea mays]